MACAGLILANDVIYEVLYVIPRTLNGGPCKSVTSENFKGLHRNFDILGLEESYVFH